LCRSLGLFGWSFVDTETCPKTRRECVKSQCLIHLSFASHDLLATLTFRTPLNCSWLTAPVRMIYQTELSSAPTKVFWKGRPSIGPLSHETVPSCMPCFPTSSTTSTSNMPSFTTTMKLPPIFYPRTRHVLSYPHATENFSSSSPAPFGTESPTDATAHWPYSRPSSYALLPYCSYLNITSIL
jgi:hypothetical protein